MVPAKPKRSRIRQLYVPVTSVGIGDGTTKILWIGDSPDQLLRPRLLRIVYVLPEISGQPAIYGLGIHFRDHEPYIVRQSLAKSGTEVLTIKSGDEDSGVRKRCNPRLNALNVVENIVRLRLCAGLAERKEIGFHDSFSSSVLVEAGGSSSSNDGLGASRFFSGSSSERSSVGVGVGNSFSCDHPHLLRFVSVLLRLQPVGIVLCKKCVAAVVINHDP